MNKILTKKDHIIYTYALSHAPSLCPSPYLVLTKHGYTNVTEVESRENLFALPRCSNVTEGKHYYAGTDLCGSREQSQTCLSYAEMQQSVRSKRLAARIGGGFDRAILHEQTDLAMTATHLFKQSQHHTNERHLNAPPAHTIRREGHLERVFRGMEIEFAIPEAVRAEVHLDPEGLIQAAQNIVANNAEPNAYFYHSDHLGSASWITDGDGMPVQHLQYLPYGEPYINQRVSGYSERFTFTGKNPRKGWRIPLNKIKYNEQRDEETGYSYFGARNMDHELMTMWLSVDPMMDKYPNVSPYAYCVWNPVKLIDTDGRFGTEFDSNARGTQEGTGLTKRHMGTDNSRVIIG